MLGLAGTRALCAHPMDPPLAVALSVYAAGLWRWRRPTYTQELAAGGRRVCNNLHRRDISYGQFRQQLKRFLFLC